jgi:gliding motility-associated lipoprotein GldD
MHNQALRTCCLITVTLILSGCSSNEDYFAPKPKGYFRIDLPEKEYRIADTIYPCTFEYPVYADIVPETTDVRYEYWFNIVFPDMLGALHFSYKRVNNNLYNFTEDTRTFVYKHVPKAEDITAKEVNYPENRVFALIYTIDGTDAASPLQFYVTDSTNHFMRGAMYFLHSPNNDSIRPVIDFMTDDVLHMIETLRWK